MSFSIIVAMTDARVIGRQNKLPWHISNDLKRFKAITMGHALIMGRKTYESIGRPLPGRQNIVLTRSEGWSYPGAQTASNLKEAISLCENGRDIFVIGGAGVFAEALPQVDRLYLTMIHHPFQGEITFPKFQLDEDFKIIEKKEEFEEKGQFPYTILIAERKSPKEDPR